MSVQCNLQCKITFSVSSESSECDAIVDQLTQQISDLFHVPLQCVSLCFGSLSTLDAKDLYRRHQESSFTSLGFLEFIKGRDGNSEFLDLRPSFSGDALYCDSEQQQLLCQLLDENEYLKEHLVGVRAIVTDFMAKKFLNF